MDKFISAEDEKDFEDAQVETEELLLGPKCGEKIHRLPLPNLDSIISYEIDGLTPTSYFKDDTWVFNNGSKPCAVYFGKKAKGYNLQDTHATLLRDFQKIIGYYFVPGKNPYFNIDSPMSLKAELTRNKVLLEYFYNHGYLLQAHDGNFIPISAISVDNLREEVRARIKADAGQHNVISFTQSISRWAVISSLAELPPEFASSFTSHAFWDGGLYKEVSDYFVSKAMKHTAIEFDNLKKLIDVSIKYTINYSRDILFLNERLNELRNEGGHNFLRIGNKTKDIITQILIHPFFQEEIDGKQKRWFVTSELITQSEKGHEKWIRINKILCELNMLAGVSIFNLLIWTAMRAGELMSLKVDGLIVNGKPIDLDKDTLIQVEDGTEFSIIRPVSKTEKGYGSIDHRLPVPKICATAFAILIELFRESRKQSGNRYLFLVGLSRNHSVNLTLSSNQDYCSATFIRKSLDQLTTFAGVEHIYPHQCRKSLATLMINYDPLCLELIKDILCHKSIAMTMVYLMSLPGVSEEAMRILWQYESDRMVEYFADAAEGKLAGKMGDDTLNTIKEYQELLSAEVTPTTIKEFLGAYLESDYRIIRSPAAWCLRYPSKITWDAPCLPPQALRNQYDGIAPNPDRCQPWLCQYAAHTSRDLGLAKGRLAWAKKAASAGNHASFQGLYEKQIKYWERVVYQLQYGRDDIAGLHIIEKSLGIGGV